MKICRCVAIPVKSSDRGAGAQVRADSVVFSALEIRLLKDVHMIDFARECYIAERGNLGETQDCGPTAIWWLPRHPIVVQSTEYRGTERRNAPWIICSIPSLICHHSSIIHIYSIFMFKTRNVQIEARRISCEQPFD